jgi:hypothetical protein
MTKKTRIRVARIAAGAVIAAGASLTAAGAASAAEAEDCLLGILCAEESPVPTPTPTPTPTEEPTGIPTNLPTDPPSTEEPPAEPTDEPTEPTEDPTDEPSSPGNGNGNGNGGGNGNANGGGNGGGNNADPDGGASTQEQGSSALTDTGSDNTPAPQAQAGGPELAETGAAQTTFLVLGAATMIAGGVGFRVLPRLMGGRGGAAA